jgi:putative membrane protein
MEISGLPVLNASLNAAAAGFIIAGLVCIKTGRKQAHIACMATALTASAVFLVSYLIYHFTKGEPTPFGGTGAIRMVYYVMLLTHIVLAVVNLPMIIVTVVPALRHRFDKHKRIARWTWPVWLYVSVTGILVYFFLYVWYPADPAN